MRTVIFMMTVIVMVSILSVLCQAMHFLIHVPDCYVCGTCCDLMMRWECGATVWGCRWCSHKHCACKAVWCMMSDAVITRVGPPIKRNPSESAKYSPR